MTTPAAVALICAEMRAICTAEPHAPHASCTRNAGTLFASLTRYGRDFALELSDEAPIPPETAQAWASAAGAPDGADVRSMAQGRVMRYTWQEEGFDAAGDGPKAFYFGGTHGRD